MGFLVHDEQGVPFRPKCQTSARFRRFWQIFSCLVGVSVIPRNGCELLLAEPEIPRKTRNQSGSKTVHREKVIAQTKPSKLEWNQSPVVALARENQME